MWVRTDEQTLRTQLIINILTLLGIMGSAAIWAYGIASYNADRQQRLDQAHLTAWQVINSAQGQQASGGRIEALEILSKDGVRLDRLDARGAYLGSINLA